MRTDRVRGDVHSQSDLAVRQPVCRPSDRVALARRQPVAGGEPLAVEGQGRSRGNGEYDGRRGVAGRERLGGDEAERELVTGPRLHGRDALGPALWAPGG